MVILDQQLSGKKPRGLFPFLCSEPNSIIIWLCAQLEFLLCRCQNFNCLSGQKLLIDWNKSRNHGAQLKGKRILRRQQSWSFAKAIFILQGRYNDSMDAQPRRQQEPLKNKAPRGGKLKGATVVLKLQLSSFCKPLMIYALYVWIMFCLIVGCLRQVSDSLRNDPRRH